MEEKLTIGEKVRYFRTRSGLSQLELELLIQMSHGSLSRIENNRVNPHKETVSKIIKALRLKPNEIIFIYKSY